jgi:hypothetical protein
VFTAKYVGSIWLPKLGGYYYNNNQVQEKIGEEVIG